ncbi:MAG: hypothetical protein Q8R40_01470 [bacterium]|nr:hypothetical protein [bacterium]
MQEVMIRETVKEHHLAYPDESVTIRRAMLRLIRSSTLLILPFVGLLQWKKLDWYARYISIGALICLMMTILDPHWFMILTAGGYYLAADIGLMFWFAHDSESVS